MFRRGQTEMPLIEGELVYVNIDPSTKVPSPFPQRLRDCVRAFELTAAMEENADAAR